MAITPVEAQAIREINKSTAERRHVAKKEMALAAKQGGERHFFKEADGFKEMQVHAESFHYWGQKIGYDCWDNKKWKKEYRRDVPESRVKNRPVNPTICLATVPRDRVDALFGPDGRMNRRRGDGVTRRNGEEKIFRQN